MTKSKALEKRGLSDYNIHHDHYAVITEHITLS